MIKNNNKVFSHFHYRGGFIYLLRDLLCDLLCADLFSQLVAHLRKALRALTRLPAAHGTAIHVETLLLLLGNQEDFAEIGGATVATGQHLQHRSSQNNSLSMAQVVLVRVWQKGEQEQWKGSIHSEK